MIYDVIVIGVGSMGSATCYHLAKRGAKVLGLEQFDIAHDKGSHAGESRLIRMAYFEHPDYVPLLESAYHLWDELENESGEHLFHKTGIYYAGPENGFLMSGIEESSRLYNIPVDKMNRDEVSNKWPQFKISDDLIELFEKDAGFVRPELSIETLTNLAKKHGADILTGEKALYWKVEDNVVKVKTGKNEYQGNRMIITAGAYAHEILGEYTPDLKVTQQLLAWFDVRDEESFTLGNFPCFGMEEAKGLFYGFPILPFDGLSSGLKIAYHYPGSEIAPDQILNFNSSSEEVRLRGLFDKYFNKELGKLLNVKACMYTFSSDDHFIINELPGFEDNVTIATGFSGHGFKFIPVVGEILTDLTLEGKTNHPIDFLNVSRFTTI